MNIPISHNRSPLPPEPTHDERRQKGRLRGDVLACEFGHVVNISASGLRVRSEEEPALTKGQQRRITLETVDASLDIVIEVLWVQHTGAACYEFGAKFLDVTQTIEADLTKLASAALSQTPFSYEMGAAS